MQGADFKAEKFPFKTTNAELRTAITNIITPQSTPIAARIAALSETGKALYKKGLEAHEIMQKMVASTGWEQREKAADHSSYTMKGEGGFMCVKSVAIIPATPMEVLGYLFMEKYKCDYDLNYLSGKDIEVFPANLRLSHWIFKGKMFVSNRDFSVVQYTIYNADGSINLAAVSVEDPRIPAGKDAVRGRVMVRVANSPGVDRRLPH